MVNITFSPFFTFFTSREKSIAIGQNWSLIISAVYLYVLQWLRYIKKGWPQSAENWILGLLCDTDANEIVRQKSCQKCQTIQRF